MKPFKMFSLKQQRYFTATDFIMVALEGKANSNNIKVKSSPKKILPFGSTITKENWDCDRVQFFSSVMSYPSKIHQ